MKQFCENQYCDSPGAKVVPVSVERPSDETRTLCVPCEEAYTIGVQHGRKVAEGKAAQTRRRFGPHIQERELATILAALRHYQDDYLREGAGIVDKHLEEIATDGGTLKPLTSQEVNHLCESLNFDTSLSPGLIIAAPDKETRGQQMFRVVYVIDVNAAGPLKAAQQTYQILLDPDSLPPVMDVIDYRGRVRRIDLSQPRRSRQKGRPS